MKILIHLIQKLGFCTYFDIQYRPELGVQRPYIGDLNLKFNATPSERRT